MEKVVLLLCFVTAGTAIFFPFGSISSLKEPQTRVCINSVDPSRYTPKCFLCGTRTYQSVLSLCLQMSSLPNNVTYTQANCIEGNCKIGRTKRSVPSSEGGPNSLEGSEGPYPGLRLHHLNSPQDTSFKSDAKQNDKDVKIDAEEETNAGAAEYFLDMDGVDEAVGDY